MVAKLSILGLLTYDPTLFDGLLIPPDMIKEVVIDSILSEAAELPVKYPEPELMKRMLNNWSGRKLPIWIRLSKLITYEYNPVENYDRIEEWSDSSTGSSSGSSQSASNSRESLDTKTVEGETAYNTNVFTDNRRSVTSGNPESTATVQSSGSTQSTNINNHSGRLHGNIGVTTAAQMITGELEMLPKLDIYQVIVNDFIDTFCIGIY